MNTTILTTSLIPYPVKDTLPVPAPVRDEAAKRRALIVADSVELCIRVARRLVACGYECAPATVAELIDAVDRGEVAAVVVDLESAGAREGGLWRTLQASPSVVRILLTKENDVAALNAKVRPSAYDAVVQHDAVATTLGTTICAAAAARVDSDEEVMPNQARRLARAMVRTLALRGYETELHCLRVAVWARALGKVMGLSSARLLDVELGAMLHDIGQLATPEQVEYRVQQSYETRVGGAPRSLVRRDRRIATRDGGIGFGNSFGDFGRERSWRTTSARLRHAVQRGNH